MCWSFLFHDYQHSEVIPWYTHHGVSPEVIVTDKSKAFVSLGVRCPVGELRTRSDSHCGVTVAVVMLCTARRCVVMLLSLVSPSMD